MGPRPVGAEERQGGREHDQGGQESASMLHRGACGQQTKASWSPKRTRHGEDGRDGVRTNAHPSQVHNELTMNQGRKGSG